MAKPFLWWLIIATFSFIASFLVSDSSVDIHMHDTYFIVAYQHVIWLISACCFIISVILFLFRSLLKNKVFFVAHITSFLIGIVLCFVPFKANNKQIQPIRYIDISSQESLLFLCRENLLLSIGCVLFASSFLILLFWVVSALIGKVIN